MIPNYLPFTWPSETKPLLLAAPTTTTKLMLKFVLVIPWLRGRFQINFPTQFTKSEISRAQRGKFDFVN